MLLAYYIPFRLTVKHVNWNVLHCMQQIIAVSYRVTWLFFFFFKCKNHFLHFDMALAINPCSVNAMWFCSPAPPLGEQRALNSLSTPQITRWSSLHIHTNAGFAFNSTNTTRYDCISAQNYCLHLIVTGGY